MGEGGGGGGNKMLLCHVLFGPSKCSNTYVLIKLMIVKPCSLGKVHPSET